jgi:hypothetical protein
MTALLDEYRLGAFIAGTLPERERSEVVAHLLVSGCSREWMHWACEAMAAVRLATPLAQVRAHRSLQTAAQPGRREDRRARKPVHQFRPFF